MEKSNAIPSTQPDSMKLSTKYIVHEGRDLVLKTGVRIEGPANVPDGMFTDDEIRTLVKTNVIRANESTKK